MEIHVATVYSIDSILTKLLYPFLSGFTKLHSYTVRMYSQLQYKTQIVKDNYPFK